MNDIITYPYENIAISTHGGVVNAILNYFGENRKSIQNALIVHFNYDNLKWKFKEFYNFQ